MYLFTYYTGTRIIRFPATLLYETVDLGQKGVATSLDHIGQGRKKNKNHLLTEVTRSTASLLASRIIRLPMHTRVTVTL